MHRPRFFFVVLLAVLLAAAACGRARHRGGGGGLSDAGPGPIDGGGIDSPAELPDVGPCTTPVPETCNGRDDDCDGSADEDFFGLGSPCSDGIGACEVSGSVVCSPDGTSTQCSAIARSPGAEVCNGIDDDCNGISDDDVAPTTCGTGACQRTAACIGGVPVTCVPGAPGTEVCNGVDDDCDGATDEVGSCGALTPFHVTSFGATGCRVAQHEPPSGDDRGGVAVSTSRVFVTGDSATVRLDNGTLGGVATVAPLAVHDGMVNDVATGQVYVLLDGAGTEPGPAASAIVTQLGVLDGTTGALGATRIPLSMSIATTDDTGVFGGYGGALLAVSTGSRYQWWRIALPSGAVTRLGDTQLITHHGCENWAWWGIAEYFGGAHYASYVESNTTIARIPIPAAGPSDVVPTPAGTFTNLGDMCSIAFSATLSRWYSHFEYDNQFGGIAGSGESASSCDATWE